MLSVEGLVLRGNSLQSHPEWSRRKNLTERQKSSKLKAETSREQPGQAQGSLRGSGPQVILRGVEGRPYGSWESSKVEGGRNSHEEMLNDQGIVLKGR